MTTQSTLYDRLGGSLAIRPVTEAFYRKVLADDLLASYFDDVDMDRQIAKQAAFLTVALGGPNNYSGRDLRVAHSSLGELKDEHFDKVVAHLAQTLREFGVGDEDIAAVGAVAESVRNDVLNR
ncbi:MAG TPA: group 1 truncated hemoglobin [Streptosporangiaceae bacterium]|nr:group 1 truncated hemoglobin [Streptosporangiaceae bacterium]